MTKRILLAGILGGIAMFLWSSVAHVILPLGHAGIKEIPNEASVLSAMYASLGEKSGMYLFPGMELGAHPTREQEHSAMQHYGEKLAGNPSHSPEGNASAEAVRRHQANPDRGFSAGANEADELWLSCWICDLGGSSGGHHHKYLLLELVWFSGQLYRGLHDYRDCRLSGHRYRGGAGHEKWHAKGIDDGSLK